MSSQISFDTLKSVKLTANVDQVNESITLKWIIDPGSTSYQVFKKDPAVSSWGNVIFESAATDSIYIDLDIEKGKLYEYKVIKHTPGHLGFGYLYSGIDYQPKSFNQGVLLIIEEVTFDSTKQEIELLESTLFNEGWIVRKVIVNKDSSVQYVKSRIAEVNLEFNELSTVLLVGNVPLPHSGNINPDAHTDHKGAWSADIYYGELDGIWTDLTVDNISSSNPRNHNIPGDGNLDQDFIPDSVDLAIGRIDFSELPVFESNEYELLRSYIFKNIAYRTKEYIPRHRAVFKNRNPYEEGLGQNALRNFSVIVSPDSIVYEDFFDAFYDSFLWSYGGSSGSQISSLALGNINTYANNNFQSTFTAYFGSYYGDYDFENNYLRTILASGKVLTTAWVGAPHWFFHPMAMGANMGNCVVLTQNNKDTYHAGDFPGSVHINLLGDPTLKSFIVYPPTDLNSAAQGNSIHLSWQHTGQEILGFNIYQWLDSKQCFEKINEEIIAETQYVDSCATSQSIGNYIIRAVNREITPSGVFLNESSGISIQVVNTPPIVPKAAFEIYTNGDTIFTNNTSENAEKFIWKLSNDSVYFSDNFELLPGNSDPLEITLIAQNYCYSDTIKLLHSPTFTHQIYLAPHISIGPNPIHSNEFLQIELSEFTESLTIFDLNGKTIVSFSKLAAGTHKIRLPKLSSGHIYLTFRNGPNVQTKRILYVQ